VTRTRRGQVLLDASPYTQYQRGFLKQGQTGPAGDGITGRRKLEIESFLRYSRSKHLAAPIFTSMSLV
jgi:hypothetical protein